jgi:ABC-type multidrug transport system permease subunit
MAVMNFVMLPMFFLSGAIFPPKGLPSWAVGGHQV